MTWGSPRASLYVKCVGYSEGCVPPACVDSQEVRVTKSEENVERPLQGWRLHHSSVVRASLATSEGPWFESWWWQSIFSSDFSRLSLSLKPVNILWLGAPRVLVCTWSVWVTVRAASHPPVWIHRKCELRSLKKMLNGLCRDDDYTIAQWLEHRWLQARVPGSSPGGDSQFFLQTFPVCLFPLNQLIFYDLGLPAC